MSMWRQLQYGAKHLFFEKEWRRDIDDEVEQFLHDTMEDLHDSGLPLEAARRAGIAQSRALKESIQELEDRGWEARFLPYMRDFRAAVRHILGYRRVTYLTTLCLAVAIGLNASALRIGSALLFDRIPALDGGTVLRLSTAWPLAKQRTYRVTALDSVDVRSSVRSLSDVSLFQTGKMAVQVQGIATYIPVAKIDPAFLRIFAIQPVQGRGFTERDAHHAALISAEFARTHFAAASTAVGKILMVDGDAVEIVGIMPRNFTFPEESQIWEAASANPGSLSRTAFNYQAVARLRTGVRIADANEQLAKLSSDSEERYPTEDRGKTLLAEVLHVESNRATRNSISLMMGLTAGLLFLALLNSSGFHILCAGDWRRWSLYSANMNIPAARIRKIVCMECAMLSCLAGLGAAPIGALAEYATVSLMRKTIAPAYVFAREQGHPTWLSVCAVTAVSLLLLCWVSVRTVGKIKPSFQLCDPGVSDARDRTSPAWQVLLTITFLLFCAAGLLLREMKALRTTALGFDRGHLVIVDTASQAYKTISPEEICARVSRILKTYSARPEVESVAAAMGTPFGEYGSNGEYEVSETDGNRPRSAHANFTIATPGYFQTLHIPLFVGRDFTPLDKIGSDPVAIISESLAKQRFGTIAVLGRHIRCGLDSGQWMTIVGVAGDVKQNSLSDQNESAIYMPLAQHIAFVAQMSIVIRTTLPADRLQEFATPLLRSIDPTMALHGTTMDRLVNTALAGERFRAWSAGWTGIIGFLLAGFGLYGYFLSRHKEPSADGFPSRDSLVSLGLGKLSRGVAQSTGAGLITLVLFSPLIRQTIPSVSSTDPVSIAIASALLVLVVAGARWVATFSPPAIGRHPPLESP